MAVLRGEAGGVTERARDVFDAATFDALQVVVVICRCREFVYRAVVVWQVDAAHETGVREVAHDAMHCGECDAYNVVTDFRVEHVGRTVGVSGKCRVDRDALGGHA